MRPDDGQLWCFRGRYHALRSHWEQAAADFGRGVRSAPPESEEWFEHACLRLIVGDNEGYRAAVREIRRRAGRTEDPFVAYTLARMSNLTARSVVDPEQVIRWAQFAVERRKYPWYVRTLGMSHYRAGHLDEALKSLTDPGTVDSSVHATMEYLLMLAMVHQCRGESARARELLDQAERSWQGVERTKIAEPSAWGRKTGGPCGLTAPARGYLSSPPAGDRPAGILAPLPRGQGFDPRRPIFPIDPFAR